MHIERVEAIAKSDGVAQGALDYGAVYSREIFEVALREVDLLEHEYFVKVQVHVGRGHVDKGEVADIADDAVDNSVVLGEVAAIALGVQIVVRVGTGPHLEAAYASREVHVQLVHDEDDRAEIDWRREGPLQVIVRV